MSPAAVLLSLALTAFTLGSASATQPPLIPRSSKSSLAFAAQVNVTGFASILANDQARARAFMERSNGLTSGKAPINIPVNNTGFIYGTSVGFGSPPNYYNLFIDISTANTWVGSDKPYVKTSTSKPTGKSVSVSYGSGPVTGTEYIDQVALSSSLVVKSQYIGVVDSPGYFNGFDGLLGLGPVDLTKNTVKGLATVPTIPDNLHSQGTISSEIIGVFFAPYVTGKEKTGELTFGGVDTSKITSPVKYGPVTTTFPSNTSWGINQSVTYGSTTILSSAAGLLDTGTTLILFPTDAYKKYQEATGATLNKYTQLLQITPAQYKSLKPLNFKINGATYSLSPNAQIWPRALNTQIAGSPSDIYLVIANLGTHAKPGFEFVNGYTFLERYYSVFDTTNKRIGLAPTAFTSAETN